MELTREHFRAIIFHNFRRGLSQEQCLAELVSIYKLEAPSKTTIYRWYSEFRRGRSSLTTVPSTGRPKTAVTQDNIDAVRQLIKEDRHVTYEQIRASLSIGMTAIQTILHEELGVKKLVSRWVPHRLTEEQKSARVNWCRSALQRFNGGSSNAVYNIVSGDESWIYSYENNMSSKVRSSQQKLFAHAACRKKWSLRLYRKLAMWLRFHYKNKGRLLLIGTQQFVCRKS
ncbi:hypothetical protein JYU34_015577 [Plutella xylostella]|uniref:Mos1 transposase HTH domain-containing protein n=1 Tax=Plutella xylostella TaxID=51655 RepID=A0ABQ7Q580_PLUXY|nr:hypothetical protein JYU34_015577 [Plutella xylostella]